MTYSKRCNGQTEANLRLACAVCLTGWLPLQLPGPGIQHCCVPAVGIKK